MHNEDEIIKNNTETTNSSTNQEETETTDEVEDVSFEEINEDGEVDVRATVKKLREKIKKLEGEKQEYLDLSQRTRADYANYKKEVEANRVSDRKFATKHFIEELLPVLDSYDMAQGNKEAWEKVDANWRMGIEYIFNQFKTVLEGEGVKQFGKVGDTFDPTMHESIEHVKVENEKENDTIVKVLQNGYKMNDSIIRPARVHTGLYEKETN